jgi:ABC-type multidrug transport system fused ATPase/permease subunit
LALIKKLVQRNFTSFSYFYSYLGYKMLIVIGLSVLVGFLDGLGLSMFLPLLQLADGSKAIGENSGELSVFFESLKQAGIPFTVSSILLLLFLFFVMKGLAVYATLSYKVRTNLYFISKLRVQLTRLLTHYSYKSFVTADLGHLQNSMTGEIARVASAYKSYSECIQQIVMVLVYLAFVFFANWQFALLMCFGGILSNVLFRRFFSKTKKESIGLTMNQSRFQGLILQYMSNFKYLKTTGNLERYGEKLQKSIYDIEKNNTSIGMLSARATAMREPFMIGIVCSVIFIQVYFIEGGIGTIFVSLMFFYRALSSLMVLQTHYNTYLANSGSLDNITSFEKELKENAEKDGTVPVQCFSEAITLKSINFGYNPEQLILKDISLSIKKNTTIAFVGESGSGKTTLVNLISGLLQPNSGNIQLDTIDFKLMQRSSYQEMIGYITQEPVIFNDTIFNNVTLWDAPTPENKLRFAEALQKASIENFVAELPLREESVLGNHGVNLSGGQRQRISIARELYKRLEILILDEATSALDSETEKEIKDNIDQLSGKYTILIIAHRLSTIRHVDKIVLMDKGKITAMGTFDELVQQNDKFSKMVALQEL